MLQNLQAELAEVILNNLSECEIVNKPAHLSIHHHTMMTTLTNVLKNVYPLIVKLLGFDFFYLAAKEYISNYPSRSSNLHDYGEYFSDFLSHYPPLKNLSYLHEVAKFEWACKQIYYAQDHAPLDINTLENISPTDYSHLHFILHPASCVMKFHYPILKIIDLCQETTEEELNLNAGGIELLIIRRERDISLISLSSEKYIFLNALQQNKTLSETLDEVTRNYPDFLVDAHLAELIQDNIIVAFYYE